MDESKVARFYGSRCIYVFALEFLEAIYVIYNYLLHFNPGA